VAEDLRQRGEARTAVLRDLMNATVLTTTPDASVAEAAAGMVRARVGSAIVMQGSFLAGILTERDVLRAAASADDLRHTPVSAWMTTDPQSASPDTTAAEAAQIMMLNGFRHLPVVEGRRVLGVVSLRELFAARIRRPSPG
jgi:CBS domain-containing protein